ncbi:hypothetical protein AVEN_206665-1, partial [Araneus ventricosus]
YDSKARTFIGAYKDDSLYLKCYSDNLHLYQSRSKPETLKFDFDNKWNTFVSRIDLDQMDTEPFYPTDEPQVFVGIHSPYVPIDIYDLHAIIPGKAYEIDVQLAKQVDDPTGYVYENRTQLSPGAELLYTTDYKWYKAILEKNRKLK